MKASAAAKQAIERVKQDVPLLDFVRGDLLARKGHIEEPESAFAREVKNFPAERQPYASLAVLYWLEGRRDRAQQTLESLVRANPQRESFLLAAKTFRELGDPRAAASWRARAAKP